MTNEEFWGKCGLRYRQFSSIVKGKTERPGWYLGDNWECDDEPDIDNLEHLFRYAMPLLGYWLLSQERNQRVGAVVQRGRVSSGLVFGDGAAQALRQAMEQMMEAEK